MALVLVFLSGCVSSTLDSRALRPVGANDVSAQKSATSLQAVEQQQSGNSAGPIDLAGSNTRADTPASTTVSENDKAVDAENSASPLDPAARERAIAEMREKAQNSSGQKTRFGLLPEASSDPMDTTKQQRLKSELGSSAKDAQATTTDEELAAKRRSIEAMRRKARTHFQDTLKRIEN